MNVSFCKYVHVCVYILCECTICTNLSTPGVSFLREKPTTQDGKKRQRNWLSFAMNLSEAAMWWRFVSIAVLPLFHDVFAVMCPRKEVEVLWPELLQTSEGPPHQVLHTRQAYHHSVSYPALHGQHLCETTPLPFWAKNKQMISSNKNERSLSIESTERIHETVWKSCWSYIFLYIYIVYSVDTFCWDYTTFGGIRLRLRTVSSGLWTLSHSNEKDPYLYYTFKINPKQSFKGVSP